jgi:hypothetical protein
MTEHCKRPRDRAQLAKFIVDIATQGGSDQGGYPVPAFLILLMSRSIEPMVFDSSMRAFAISSIF